MGTRNFESRELKGSSSADELEFASCFVLPIFTVPCSNNRRKEQTYIYLWRSKFSYNYTDLIQKYTAKRLNASDQTSRSTDIITLFKKKKEIE